MPDWVKESLQRVKENREERKRNRAAVQDKAIDLFGKFAGAANIAVEQFNEGDELKSLIFSQGPSHKFTVQVRGQAARIDIELDLEGEVISYSYSDVPLASNWVVNLEANELGDLILNFIDHKDRDLKSTNEEGAIIRKLLKPVFDCVE